MKKFFPGRKHISILTHIFVSAIFFFIIYFSSSTQALAASCCNPGWTYVQITDKCFNPSANLSINTLCTGTSAPLCKNNVCVVSGTVIQPPVGSTCGFEGQSCCLPLSNLPTCGAGTKTSKKINSPSDYAGCTCIKSSGTANAEPVTVCSYAGDKEGECNSCLTSKGIWTALGCIPFNQDEFVVSVVKIIMGVAGLITLAMMLVATVMLMTGGGNSEQMKRGKEIFTGAVVGLLFLIFSVVILQIITKDIIKIDITEPNGPINRPGGPIQPI